jgi:C-methyltransferase
MGDAEWQLNISGHQRVSFMARRFVCRGEAHMRPTEVKIPPAKVARIVERFRHHLYRLHQRSTPAPAVMFEMVVGAWVAQAIQVAAELGIADALSNDPLPLDDLADRVGADPDALRRLMRALISRGIFRQRRDGRYDLTALAETLRSDAPFSMHGYARLVGSPQHREHWSLLVESVKSGKAILPQLRGKEGFDYLRDEPELAKLFNDAMAGLDGLAAIAVVAGYSFSPYRTIVDVGGGHGGLLSTILAATPNARGVLYDLPEVVAGASALLSQQGVKDRVRVEGGSFFDSVPSGGDAYVLKNVIHDWPDAQAVAILRNVRAAARADATVLLVETVLPEHDRDFAGKWVDLEMLLLANGRERTAAECRELLRQAGFRMNRVVQTASPFSVVEATPA